MLKSFIGKFFIFALLCSLGSSTWAADAAAGAACQSALDQAGRDLANKRDASAPVSTSSTDGQQQASNPISDIISKMSEGQQKQAELAQKAAEQAQKLANDRYTQLNEINDKIHEFQKGDFKRRMEIKDAQTALKKQQSMIRIKCQAKAEADYQAEFDKNNKLSQQAQYQVSDIGHMAGTDKRMQQSLALYKRRCLTNPATLEEMQNVQDEYDGKIHNFKIVAEEIASDINYTESKIDLVNEHFVSQQNDLQASLAAQQAALQQQQQMQMMQLGFAMLTSAAGQSSDNQAAAEFHSADEVLRNWEQLQARCLNNYSKPFAVPYDLVPIFGPVNTACRASGGKCVESSGKSSTPTPSTSTSG
jgi:hypothetical protein